MFVFQGRFTIAAKHHMTIAEVYETELVDIEKVKLSLCSELLKMLYSMLGITVAEVSRYSRIMNKALGVEQHDAEGGVRCLRQVHYSPISEVGTPRMLLSRLSPNCQNYFYIYVIIFFK